MADESKQGLLERIEGNAREASPLWQWLFWLGLLALPAVLGAAGVALLEHRADPLPYGAYSTALRAMGVGTFLMTAIVIWDTKKGYTRALLRRPDPRGQPPGGFRLGSALVVLFYRRWWGIPAAMVGTALFMDLWDERGLGNVPRDIFWNGMVMVSSFIALAAAMLFAVFVVGLIVRQRMRERGRPL